MNLEFSDADRAFQQEVREFLREKLPDDIRDRWVNSSMVFPEKSDGVRWHKILHERGWVAPNWPTEHGGPGWTTTQKYIFDLESASYGAPPVIPLGLRMVGPVLMKYGTDEQKERWLPKILNGEEYWCQGYSEPGSGSDLASLKTKAESDGDDYIVNGSKIWTTHAHFADWMFCLVRTSNEPKKQDGISFILIDMTTPGIEVRPLITMAGHHEVNQVFFTDVRVPKANLVGPEGEGWSVAKYLLEFERGGGFYTGRLAINLERLKKVAAMQVDAGEPLSTDPDFRRKLTEVEIAASSITSNELRILSKLTTGQNPGAESSVIKLRGSEVLQSITELTMEAGGTYACPFGQLEYASGANEEPVLEPEEAGSAARYLNYRAATIFGGTSEVQRGILAKHALGL